MATKGTNPVFSHAQATIASDIKRVSHAREYPSTSSSSSRAWAAPIRSSREDDELLTELHHDSNERMREILERAWTTSDAKTDPLDTDKRDMLLHIEVEKVKAGEIRTPNGFKYNPDIAQCRRALALGYRFCPTSLLAAAAAGDVQYVAWARSVGQVCEKYYASKGVPLPPRASDPHAQACGGKLPWFSFLPSIAQVRNTAQVDALMRLLWCDMGDGKHTTSTLLDVNDWYEFLTCAVGNANYEALEWCVKHVGAINPTDSNKGASVLCVPLPPLDTVDTATQMVGRSGCTRTEAALRALRVRVASLFIASRL